jgi:hypothetical protein
MICPIVDFINVQKPPSSDQEREMQDRAGRSGAYIPAGKGYRVGIDCRGRRKRMA